MPRTRQIDLGLRSRGGTYTLVLGVVIGLLAAGLAIPFVFGESLDSVQSTSNPLRPRGAADDSDPAGAALRGDAAGDAEAGATGRRGGAALVSGSVLDADAASGLRASDRGVSPEAITLAFLLVDLGGVSQVGFSVPGYDPETQKEYVMAFVDHINAGGGVLSRKIDPKFFSYDPTNPSSGQAACRAATQDRRRSLDRQMP